MKTEQKVTLAGEAHASYGLPSVLAALELPRATWYYHQSRGMSYTEKYEHLREPLETIAREHPDLLWIQAYHAGAAGDIWLPPQS